MDQYSRSELLLSYTETQQDNGRHETEHDVKPQPHLQVTPILNKKNNVLHVKQLSADSSSTRMKYDFSTSPNLRPKSVSGSLATMPRSSPGTPTSTRRRQPPLIPPAANSQGMAGTKVTPYLSTDSSSDDSTDDSELEVKAIQRRRFLNTSNINNSAPNLVLTKPPLTPTSQCKAPQSPRTVHSGQRGIHSPNINPVPSPLLEKKSSSLDDPMALRSRVGTPTSIGDCSSLDHKSASKPPPRRAPPDPPKPPLPPLPTGRTNTISGYAQFSKRPHVFTKQSSAGSLRHYPDTKRRGSSPTTTIDSDSNDGSCDSLRTLSPPSNNGMGVLPPGILFTPPPSRSQSLKRFGTASSQRKPNMVDKMKPAAPLVSALTAPTKPLPLIPSLKKPLPPLPPNNSGILSASVESDYAYISDTPTDNVTMTTKTNDKTVKKKLPSFDTDEYVYMSNSNCPDVNGVGNIRKPSQIGYGTEDVDDEYMSMTSSSMDFSSGTRSSNSENVTAVTESSLSEVFKEEGVELSDEYMPMYPIASQQSKDQFLSSDDYSQLVIEDEYVKMSSIDNNDTPTPSMDNKPTPSSQGPGKPLNKHPTPSGGGGSMKSELLFDYTSMYIDLDMIRASLALNQQDEEARHPKSRFSISTESAQENKSDTKNKHSVDEKRILTSPDHNVMPQTKGSTHCHASSSQSAVGIAYSHTSPSRTSHTSPQRHAAMTSGPPYPSTPQYRSKVAAAPLPNIDESLSDSTGIYASIDTI